MLSRTVVLPTAGLPAVIVPLALDSAVIELTVKLFSATGEPLAVTTGTMSVVGKPAIIPGSTVTGHLLLPLIVKVVVVGVLCIVNPLLSWPGQVLVVL